MFDAPADISFTITPHFMNISTSLRELFRTPGISDKLNHFQSLFDASELNVDLALALLKVIHAELIRDQERDGALYKRYAQLIESLNHRSPEVLSDVINAWNKSRGRQEPEWLSDGTVK